MVSYIDEARALEHLGCEIQIVVYGGVNTAIECIDCSEIIWDNGL